MKHTIIKIETYIQDKTQGVIFYLKDYDDIVAVNYASILKLWNIPVTEIELLIDSFLEPVYAKVDNSLSKAETEKNIDTKIIAWRLKLNGTLEEISERNKNLLLNFQILYDTYVFERKNKNVVRLRFTNENICFYYLDDLKKISGLKQEEFYKLRGAFLSPVFFKAGECSDYTGRFSEIKENNKIVKNLNLRFNQSIENNYEINGIQQLKNSKKSQDNYNDNARFKRSYDQYGGPSDGYGGHIDDDFINDALGGEPDAIWNLD